MLQRRPDSGLGNLRSNPANPSRNVDWVLVWFQAALMVAGCFVVYSASRTRFADPYFHLTRQVIFAIAAGLITFVVMAIDYQWLREHAKLLYAATIPVLIAQKVVFGGITIDVGPINIQPAEFAKVTVLIAVCAYLADERNHEVTYAKFLSSLIMVGVPTMLVLIQPDLGSASVLIAMVMGVLLVAGAKVRYMVAISALTVATMALAYVGNLVKDYQVERLRVLLDQDNPELREQVFQVRNAIRALGTGGLFGKGWLEGPLTNSRSIPVVWADFPFAAIGEQFGFVGCSVVLGLFVVVLIRIWRIAGLSRDRFGTYLCAGVFSMLLWQIFQNVGMTVGIMPVTGLPLPFISYGGSGLVAFSIMFAIVQSVHMRRMR